MLALGPRLTPGPPPHPRAHLSSYWPLHRRDRAEADDAKNLQLHVLQGPSVFAIDISGVAGARNGWEITASDLEVLLKRLGIGGRFWRYALHLSCRPAFRMKCSGAVRSTAMN